MKMLSRIHQLDPNGEAFRYSGHLDTTASRVDVSRLAKAFRGAFDMIRGGVLTMLDVHRTFSVRCESTTWRENARGIMAIDSKQGSYRGRLPTRSGAHTCRAGRAGVRPRP
jgi:hypothetical protein